MPRRARLASQARAMPSPARWVGDTFGDQKYAVALTSNHATDQFFGSSVTVKFRCVDQCHAERKACAQRFFFFSRRMSSLRKMPGALTERRYGGAVGEPYCAPRTI